MSNVGLVQQVVAQVIEDHHDAFLVELFGPEASGVPQERITVLLAQGVLTPDQLNRATIPGMENECDYFEFLMHVNHAIGRHHDDDDALRAMRGWTLADWTTVVDASITQGKAEIPTIPEIDEGVRVELPRPPSPPVDRGSRVRPVPPAGLTAIQTHAYTQASERAGEFARGLGQSMGIDLQDKVRETWDGEQIAVEADPEQRADLLAIIEEEVAAEVLGAVDARALAGRLANRTGMYAHNWGRIARTELQGAYNDAVVLEGVDLFGSECLIARIHETDACVYCRELFGSTDNPTIFSVAELLANGTNVGRAAGDWLPTLWPIHPNCRCDTRMIPPGMTIQDGEMVMDDG